MPATYAHYRFGSQMLQAMPADMGRAVKRNRRLYDVGLHGPDLFYYHNPAIPNQIRMLGYKFHLQTGREFFSRVCRNLRLEPSEAATAYLYGLLCHYCLDTVCHPYVRQVAERGEVTHAQLETEFERLLLETDGKVPAVSQDLSQHIRLTPGECETVARFYPPASGKTIKAAVVSMAFFVRLLAAPEGVRRNVLKKGMGVVARNFSGMLMADKPLPLSAPYLPELMEKYRQAAEQFPEMLAQLQAHMTYSAPFGQEFADSFG